MIMLRIAFMLCFAAAFAGAQCAGPADPEACNHDALRGTRSEAVASSVSTFPDAHQQIRNYLDSAFGPFAIMRAAIGAGIDQSKPAPPEWDSGAQGYAERYASRFGMFLVEETARYSLGTAMHEDVAYHRCFCTGFMPRSTHAFVSVFTARTASGRTVFSLPALVAPYAGSFTAVNLWYPARYESMDAARLGTMAFTFQIGGNMLREFLPRRH